jgi:glutathione peroxidase
MTEAIQQTVYDFSALSIDGNEIPLAQYNGKILVIVNTASQCGFTPQYAGLESLYQDYRDRGLVVLGFPCNQFGGQEPGSEAEIGQFCERNYGVSFPMFAKIEVNGPEAHPLFRFLKAEQGGVLGAIGMNAIKWNFTKFLVDAKGNVVGRFAPGVSPASLKPEIEKLLAS